MDIKYNINKLHGLLISNFKDVSIVEKSTKDFGNYFEISVKEDKEVKIIITKKDIENTNFNWKYYSNPNDELSFLIERNSSIDKISSDIKDILIKNRFNEEYLKIVK
jgi:hypothetical protein